MLNIKKTNFKVYQMCSVHENINSILVYASNSIKGKCIFEMQISKDALSINEVKIHYVIQFLVIKALS